MKTLLAGLALVVAGALAMPAAYAQGSQQQDTVELSQLPAAVQQTVKKEVGDGQIQEVERDVDNGKVVYEIEFTADGVKYEIDVAEDGKLLSRRED